MSKRFKYPSESRKLNINYPEELHGNCLLCGFPVNRKYNTSEKTIYTLEGKINVRYDLKACTNEQCKLYDVPINPSPRFDYSQRQYGKDVLAKIGTYSIKSTTKLNSQQITDILLEEYDLPISTRTVARMMDDILILTSFQIDQNTKEKLKLQKFMLIALDGQEPDGDGPALWNFTDMLSNRVLLTRYLENVNYHTIHDCIEEIRTHYPLEIIGFVSDKQSSIKKCVETFYQGIPHQYCTYHFSTNLWNHLEKYANKIHQTLNKTVKSLYINTVPADIKIKIPNESKKVSLKKLCQPLAKELISTLKNKNEKFDQLKGIVGFERLNEYFKGFQAATDQIPQDDRFAAIMKKAVAKIDESLKKVKNMHEFALEGLQFFKKIHKLLWKEELSQIEKEQALDQIFNSIWARALDLNPKYTKKERKSFLPSSKTPYWKILSEFTRLWESYRPGLFQYYKFPSQIRSNVDMEQKFSVETQRFRSQSGRGHVGQLIRSRGEYVLRLQYSDDDEIDFEQIIGNSQEHLRFLRNNLQENITQSCLYFKNNQKIEYIYCNLLDRMYGIEITKMEKD